MGKIILLLSAKIGTFVNFLNCYPNHLKNKFNYNQKNEFLLIISIILYLCGFYIYLGSKSQYLSALYYFFSLLFFIQFIMFLGMLIHKGNSELYFPLKQFYSEYKNGGFIISSHPSNFLTNKEEITSKTKPKKNLKTLCKEDELLSSFQELTNDINKREFFNSDKKCFILEKYRINPLQSFQILVIYFEKEYDLNQNTVRQHIYNLFNEYFNIEGKKMTSKNWKDYTGYINLKDENSKKHIGKSEFYNDLLKLK